MWNNDDEDDYDPDIYFPTDNELLHEEDTATGIADTTDIFSLALGPPVYVGRGIRASTLEAIRLTRRSQSGRRLEKPDEITTMMRNMGLDMVSDTNLSSKTTRRMPTVEPVIPGLVPLVNHESCFEMTPANPRGEDEAEPTPFEDDLNSTNSTDTSQTSSISYRTLESDSSSSSGTASTYSRYASGIVGVSAHEKVYSGRELYLMRGYRKK